MKFSKEEKRKYFKKQMNKAKEKVEDKIQDFLDNSEELRRFIEFRRMNFRTYSLHNTFLIYSQLPTATRVAGFRKWNELGYHVRKGEKGLDILIPLLKKEKDEDTGEERKRIYGFKVGKVFDLSQVEAEEGAKTIPEIDIAVYMTKDTQYTAEELFRATKTFIGQHCEVVEENSLGGALGMTDGKKVYVVKNPENMVDVAGVMVHEYSHFHNHFGENRKELTKDRKETEAELTTMIFGSFFNLDVENTYKYLAFYREERNVTDCFETAYKTFEYMLEGKENTKGLSEILSKQNIR